MAEARQQLADPALSRPPAETGELSSGGSVFLMSRLRAWWRLDNPALIGSLVILTVGVALFAQCLWFIPTDIDDVVVLSAAARTTQPFSYLVNDVGLGKNEYRPLHAMSVWLTYHTVGVRASVHQAINLLLHLVNVLLLFTLLARLNRNYVLATLLVLMFVVSMYSTSPAGWISDRPTLLVGLAVILLLVHLVNVEQGKAPFRISRFLGASVMALLSKESGLALPVAGLFLGYFLPLRVRERRTLQVVSFLVLTGYVVFRFFLFGEQSFVYRETGTLLGGLRYEDLSTLPFHIRLHAYAENTIKSLIAVAAPVFDNQGGIELPSPGLAGIVALLSVLGLVGASVRRRLTSEQKIAVLLLLVNGLVHASVFRHRTLYLSAICLSLFLVRADPFMPQARTGRFATALAVFFILANIVISSQRLASLSEMRLSKAKNLREALSEPSVGRLTYRIDPEVLKAIEDRYGRPPE